MKTDRERWDVAIWGSYPPPWAGMATHIVRLLDRLDREGIRARVFNRASDGENPPRAVCIRHRQASWFVQFALFAPEKVLYVLTGRPSVRFLAYMLKTLRGKRYILRIGDEQILRTLARGSRLAKWMTLVALRNAEHVVAVSPHLAEAILAQGIGSDKVRVVPGFITPPDTDAEPPEDVIEFARAHTPVLAANGQLRLEDGVSMYGVDLILSIMPQILREYPQAGLMLSLYGTDADPTGIGELGERIRHTRLADHILVRTEPHIFLPMLKYTDVFLRPTRSEGDSNSIREAISLGVPVVASDATPRPSPSVLFANGNPHSFLEATSLVLSDLPRYKRMSAETLLPDNAAPIIKLIREALD